MSYLYRPSVKVEAQAAMARLTAAERRAHEEGDLHMLRFCIQKTLNDLDPQSELAKHLEKTTHKIRQHLLNEIVQKKATPRKPRQQTVRQQTAQPEDGIPERFSHMHLDQAGAKRASTLPPGRAATMSLPPTRERPIKEVPENEPPARKPPARATRYPLRPRQQTIVELSSDESSDLSSLESDDDDDTPAQRESAPISDESADTSDMRGSAKPDSIPAQEPMPDQDPPTSAQEPMPAQEPMLAQDSTPAQDPIPAEDQQPTLASKKRPADLDGDDEASPVTKRVKGWLGRLTGGYASQQ
ncbi:hypothetical protein F53441_1240 [Fusarium austroafricanum]|uniref:Uncharacterized protein n=1 Tax=Fusarium austroafricanum TaxID=2364996 RepID=A0A8H4KW09_9HYPO|nr:hypothetical protein F53441_1240 [Fusarium austroafricanum]